MIVTIIKATRVSYEEGLVYIAMVFELNTLIL